MGDNADMILDGTLDEETGEYLGEGCGYPRSKYRQNKLSNNSAVFGLMNYLVRNYPAMDKKEKRVLVKQYSEEKLGLKFEILGFEKCCIEIQTNFNAFTQFVKNIKQNKI